MTIPERFETIYRLIRGEITTDEAVKLIGVAEQIELRLEG